MIRFPRGLQDYIRTTTDTLAFQRPWNARVTDHLSLSWARRQEQDQKDRPTCTTRGESKGGIGDMMPIPLVF
jgi:hypothetical protein